jgi:hypothetical protein
MDHRDHYGSPDCGEDLLHRLAAARMAGFLSEDGPTGDVFRTWVAWLRCADKLIEKEKDAGARKAMRNDILAFADSAATRVRRVARDILHTASSEVRRATLRSMRIAHKNLMRRRHGWTYDGDIPEGTALANVMRHLATRHVHRRIGRRRG